MPFENCQNQEISLETLCPTSLYACARLTSLPPSFPLDGELVSQHACFYCLDRGIPGELTEGTDVLVKFLREEAGSRLPRMFEHESLGLLASI